MSVCKRCHQPYKSVKISEVKSVWHHAACSSICRTYCFPTVRVVEAQNSLCSAFLLEILISTEAHGHSCNLSGCYGDRPLSPLLLLAKKVTVSGTRSVYWADWLLLPGPRLIFHPGHLVKICICWLGVSRRGSAALPNLLGDVYS